ncbi:MAG: hypothetical protein KIS78_10440 [Labilithrix sp.]|nr:hypothetical protein [Labilithrix sp.]
MLGSDLKRALVACGFAARRRAGGAFLRKKQQAVREAAALRGARAHPLVPVPWRAGPFVYGSPPRSALAMLL